DAEGVEVVCDRRMVEGIDDRDRLAATVPAQSEVGAQLGRRIAERRGVCHQRPAGAIAASHLEEERVLDSAGAARPLVDAFRVLIAWRRRRGISARYAGNSLPFGRQG